MWNPFREPAPKPDLSAEPTLAQEMRKRAEAVELGSVDEELQQVLKFIEKAADEGKYTKDVDGVSYLVQQALKAKGFTVKRRWSEGIDDRAVKISW